jgi:fructose transport system permease protein
MSTDASASPTVDDLDLRTGHNTTLTERIQHVLHSYPWLSPASVLVLAAIAFSIKNGRFARPENLGLILQQIGPVGALAVGQTLIMLTAGIDLSVGSIVILSQIIIAKVFADHGWPSLLPLLLGILVGVVLGLVNGSLITKLKLQPFIVTLGTLSIVLSIALLYAGGATISESDLSPLILWPGKIVKLGSLKITTGVLMMLALYVIFSFILKNTAWGRHVYATGDDVEAARLAGIRTDRVLLSVYAVAGLIFGIGAWILIGRSQGANTNAITDANLNTITATVIGGTSLSGGRGILFGSLIGALIVGVFNNGLTLAGVDANWKLFAVGVLIIVAAAIDQWIRKVGK